MYNMDTQIGVLQIIEGEKEKKRKEGNKDVKKKKRKTL